MAYRLSRRARRDALDIWRRIAAENEPAADSFIDLLVHHFRLLAICRILADNGMKFVQVIEVSQLESS
jgi:plasmid stabilization system protein ParE